MKNLKELKKEYLNLKDELFTRQANGDLGRLKNLREEFDETFDQFFDNFRKCDEDYDITNEELEEKLTAEEQEQYKRFLQVCIEELEDELR